MRMSRQLPATEMTNNAVPSSRGFRFITVDSGSFKPSTGSLRAEGVGAAMTQVGRLMRCNQIDYPVPKPGRRIEAFTVGTLQLSFPSSANGRFHLPAMSLADHTGEQSGSGDGFFLGKFIK